MNKKQIALTVIAMLALIGFGVGFNDDSQNKYHQGSAGGQFLVEFIVLAIIYGGLMFMLKSKGGKTVNEEKKSEESDVPFILGWSAFAIITISAVIFIVDPTLFSRISYNVSHLRIAWTALQNDSWFESKRMFDVNVGFQTLGARKETGVHDDGTTNNKGILHLPITVTNKSDSKIIGIIADIIVNTTNRDEVLRERVLLRTPVFKNEIRPFEAWYEVDLDHERKSELIECLSRIQPFSWHYELVSVIRSENDCRDGEYYKVQSIWRPVENRP